MNEDDKQPWNQLVDAAKKVGAGRPPPPGSPTPEAFVSRIRTMRQSLWSLARTILWRRWSLIAIVVAAILYLVAHLLLKPDPEPSIPTPEPPSPLAP